MSGAEDVAAFNIMDQKQSLKPPYKRPNIVRPWTDADDEILRGLAAAGKSALAIALRLGRSVPSTRTRAIKLQIELETQAERRRRMGMESGGKKGLPVF